MTGQGTFLEVLGVFARLGLTSFGGPVAHLGYFREELVVHRGWVDERRYADLVALCQFLPGPASSQVGIGLGFARAGVRGAFAAWLGFTLPSAVALVLFALGVGSWGDVRGAPWLAGLKLVAVAVVAHAVHGMAVKLTPDRPRLALALIAAIAMLVWPSSAAQLGVIGVGALVGWRWFGWAAEAPGHGAVAPTLSRRWGAALLTTFAVVLVALPLARGWTEGAATPASPLAIADAFYRTGSLVFGGGHVVLPLLEREVVPPGWVDPATFVAGYGAAQAVPGPLFTFSAYLGAAAAPGGAAGRPWVAVATAAIALVAVFAPSFLLVLGVMPFWDRLRARSGVRAALVGVNAVVVGLLLAALYEPVWTSAVTTAGDVAVVLGAYLALAVLRWPAWVVVVGTAALTAAIGAWG